MLMGRRGLVALALAGIVTAVVGLVGAAPAMASSGSVFNPIRNYPTNNCIQPQGGSTAQGAPIVQEPCNGSEEQNWEFRPLGGNTYHFINQRSGMCLDARGFGPSNGLAVDQWTCNSNSNENWQSNLPLPDAVFLRSLIARTHSHCLDVPDNSTAPDVALQLWTCNGTNAQGFVFTGVAA
jgi:hypothetical protein